MAIEWVHAIGVRSAGSDHSQGLWYGRAWEVLTDDVGESLATVLLASKDGVRIPRRGESDVDDPGGLARCSDVRATQSNKANSNLWSVTARFSYATPHKVPEIDPVRDDPDVSLGVIKYIDDFLVDVNGDPVRNSAGDPFANPLGIQRSYIMRRVTRNERNFNIQFLQFVNTINGDDYGIEGIGQSYMNDISVSPRQYRGAFPFVRVSYETWIRFQGWDVEAIDSGVNFLTDQGERRHIVDAEGQKAAGPVNLDGSGGVQPPNDDPVLLAFPGYESTNWSILNLV